MMCYRDMTFCPFHEGCAKADTCPRALTNEVWAAAKRWWANEDDPEGEGAPIAQFSEKPDCHKESKPDKET